MMKSFLYCLGKITFLSFLLVGLGCASAPKTIDPQITGPQVVVSPEIIRLGVVTLRDTNIIFQGAGFKPGDSIFIALDGPQETRIIVAEARIKPDGTFQTNISALTKIMEILRANIILDEKFQNVVVISQPPIPAGVYKAKVTSMLSKITAEAELTVKNPTLIDKFKDWIGEITGKIMYQ